MKMRFMVMIGMGLLCFEAWGDKDKEINRNNRAKRILINKSISFEEGIVKRLEKLQYLVDDLRGRIRLELNDGKRKELMYEKMRLEADIWFWENLLESLRTESEMMKKVLVRFFKKKKYSSIVKYFMWDRV